MGRIADAARRWQDVHAEQACSSEPLTCNRLAAALSSGVVSCQEWQTNWRNRIYRITLSDGTIAVAKQSRIEQSSELACEFASLRRLAALNIRHLQVPKPIAYLIPLQTYVMEVAPGKPLDRLLRQGRAREFVRACRLTGEVLAQIHNAWSLDHKLLSVEQLADDLLSIPLKITRSHGKAIRAALKQLSKLRTPVGQPYLDFKAANVLFDGHRLALIDPPEEECKDEPLAWDIAVFAVSVEHELWKRIARGSWRAARRTARLGMAQLERQYCRHLAGPRIAPGEFQLLMHIVQLQRVGQLIALQRSKLQAGRRRRIPFTSSTSRVLGAVAEALPLPLLTAHAHRLIFQIARSVRGSAASDLAKT